jgi:hypothetical protein
MRLVHCDGSNNRLGQRNQFSGNSQASSFCNANVEFLLESSKLSDFIGTRPTWRPIIQKSPVPLRPTKSNRPRKLAQNQRDRKAGAKPNRAIIFSFVPRAQLWNCTRAVDSKPDPAAEHIQKCNLFLTPDFKIGAKKKSLVTTPPDQNNGPILYVVDLRY